MDPTITVVRIFSSASIAHRAQAYDAWVGWARHRLAVCLQASHSQFSRPFRAALPKLSRLTLRCRGLSARTGPLPVRKEEMANLPSLTVAVPDIGVAKLFTDAEEFIHTDSEKPA